MKNNKKIYILGYVLLGSLLCVPVEAGSNCFVVNTQCQTTINTPTGSVTITCGSGTNSIDGPADQQGVRAGEGACGSAFGLDCATKTGSTCRE